MSIPRLTLAGLVCTLMTTPIQAAPFLPDVTAANFTGATPNGAYFPMTWSGTRVFVGVETETGEVVERFELTNVGLGPVILGVQTFAQRDRAFEEGRLVEATLDYFAQDTNGNVWYFGEDVTNFVYDEEGNLVDTNDESAWRAGVNGALPGYIMPVNLTVGFNYYQEFAAADEALDEGTISALGLTVDGFSDVLRVYETTAIEPDARGYKFFAPGFGLIGEQEGLDESQQSPELVFRFVSTPEPAALGLLGLGVLGLAWVRRRPRRVGTVARLPG